MKIGEFEVIGYAALAPMAGVADRAMREIAIEHGAAYCIGELASAKGISLGDKKSASYLKVSEAERPYGSQLFGSDPLVMAEAAKAAESFGPDFIDINMGCPAPKVAISSGGGSALMKDPLLAARIVEAVVKAVKLPVTVKMRTGWDDDSINAPLLASLVEKAGASAITVHGRTRKQMYAPPVNTDIIKQVKQEVKIPVIANGDIFTPFDAAKMYEETGCDFIMVGRGAMGTPWIFSQINAYMSQGIELPEPTMCERLDIMRRHIELLCEYKGENVGMREARKHVAWYIKGFHSAASLRNEAGTLRTLEDFYKLLKRVATTQEL